jgi:starch-binding outer membrane protein, SusD/RagB family
MKNIKNLLILALFLGLGFTACTDYVQDIDPPIDLITNDQLNDPAQADFLLAGMENRFSNIHSEMCMLSAALSDELIYDSRVVGASFPTFDEIHKGEITLDNNSVSNALTRMGSFRFHADNLVERAGLISFDLENPDDVAARDAMVFWGNYYGAIGRYFYAAYIGLDKTTGGGVIDGGAFIPSAQMYQLAFDKLTAADAVANAWQKKIINTFRAKMYLAQGMYPEAKTAAQAGLQEGDPAFASLYSAVTIDNWWWGYAGRGRTQMVPHPRFGTYVTEDPTELNRLPMDGPQENQGLTYYIQAKFDRESNSDFVNWQENLLILAETSIRVDNSAPAALNYINAVRASHGLDALEGPATLDLVYLERDKELFGMGTRVTDQRRFNRWHWDGDIWYYLPITLPERNTNDNLPKF